MRFSLRLDTKVSLLLKRQLENVVTKQYQSKVNHADDLKVKIGLEIHARILSKTKIFSDANCFDITNSPINSNVAFFDAALPGTMPCLNRRCGEAALLTALALNCQINAISNFERKHYFYADMPAGYQVTQQRMPIALKGKLSYPIVHPKTKKLSYKECQITRIQLELDSARTLNTEDLHLKLNETEDLPNNSMLIDLNRAGMGLMEIVTEPCFTSAFESYSFARELALQLRSIGTCDALMGEGGFRVDVNVSVHKTCKQSQTLLPGTRVELKNLSSFSTVLKATEYEIKRQKLLVNSDLPILMETRTFDTKSGKTVSIRSKEDQYDYRFMPEPNLLPLVVYPSKTFKPKEFQDSIKCVNNENLVLSKKYVDLIKSLGANFYLDLDNVKEDFSLKELPQKRRDFVIKKFELSDETAFIFVANNLDKLMIDILIDNDKNLTNERLLKSLVNVLTFEYLNQVNVNPEFQHMDFELKSKKVKSYLDLKVKNQISNRLKFKIFGLLFESKNMSKSAYEVVEENNLFIVNDPELIENVLNDLFNANHKAIDQYKSKPKKREKLIEFFIRLLHEHFGNRTESNQVNTIVRNSLEQLIKD